MGQICAMMLSVMHACAGGMLMQDAVSVKVQLRRPASGFVCQHAGSILQAHMLLHDYCMSAEPLATRSMIRSEVLKTLCSCCGGVSFGLLAPAMMSKTRLR